MYPKAKSSSKTYPPQLWRFLLVGFFVGCWMPGVSLAQDSTGTQVFEANPQLWTEFYFYYPQSDKLEFYFDASHRHRFLEGSTFDRFMIRPSARYKFKPWVWAGGGIAPFYTINESASNTLEFRLWQGVNLKWATIGWPKYKSMSLSFFFRIEERWTFTTEDWAKEFGTRTRYMVSGKLPLIFNKPKVSKYFYLMGMMEAFLDLTGENSDFLQDQGRIMAGIGYKLSYTWSFDFNFVWQRSRTGDGEVRTSDYLIRLKFKYNFLPIRDVDEND